MAKMNFIWCLVVYLTFSELTTGSEQSCDDWESFKDVKCIKYIDKVGLLNFTDAEAACSHEEGAKLLTISSVEEQTFLADYLYSKLKVVDNVWLGARYSGKGFNWEGGAKMTFSNWASGSPKNHENYCAEMRSEDEVKGKWADESCAKKNLVVCQRGQILSLEKMRTLLLQMRTSLENVEKELAETKKTSLLPLGFTYVQLPKEKAPSEIWPALSWTEVSSDYAGVFFRITGGTAAEFGTVQEEDSPKLSQVEVSECTSRSRDYCESMTFPGLLRLPADGTWSEHVKTAVGYATHVEHYNDSSDRRNFQIHSLRFQQHAGEVRPKNMAVKVWKRTA